MTDFYKLEEYGIYQMFFTPNFDIGLMRKDNSGLERMFVHHLGKCHFLLKLMAQNSVHNVYPLSIPKADNAELKPHLRELIHQNRDAKLILDTLEIPHSQYQGNYHTESNSRKIKFIHSTDPVAYGLTLPNELLPKTIETLFEMHKQFEPAIKEVVAFAKEYEKII